LIIEHININYLPEYRRRGFGTALQTCFIARTMEKGFVPFGQVEKDNQGSLSLQERIGMTCSEDLSVWMWK
jgi:predicted GNAT family acetyltransferase